MIQFFLFILFFVPWVCYGVNDFRYGSMWWSRSEDDPLFVTLNVETAYFYNPSFISEGNKLTSNYYQITWGDAVLSSNTAELMQINRYSISNPMAWMMGRSVFTHRYSTSGYFRIGFGGCCRSLNVVDNNGNTPYRIYMWLNLTDPVYISPRISFHPWMSFQIGTTTNFIAPVQAPLPVIFTYQNNADSFLSSATPGGFVYDTYPILSWNPPASGTWMTQFKSYYPDHPSTYVVAEISMQVYAADIVMPNPPIMISTTAEFDGYNISAGPGETIEVIMQSSSSNETAATNVEWSIWPINTTVSECAEGTKTGEMRPFSLTNTCTRTFIWTVNSYEYNYDITFMSRDENMVGSSPVQYQIKIVPPKPIIESVDNNMYSTTGGGNNLLTITGENLVNIIESEPIVVIIGNKECTQVLYITDNQIKCTIPINEGENLPIIVRVNGRESLPFLSFSYFYTTLVRTRDNICADMTPQCGGCTSIQSIYTDGFDNPDGTASCGYCQFETSYIYEECIGLGLCDGTGVGWSTPTECKADWPIDSCLNYTSLGCESCTSHPECGWCGRQEENTGMCISGDAYGPYEGICSAELGGWRYYSLNAMNCDHALVTDFSIDLLTNPSAFIVNGGTPSITGKFDIYANRSYYFRIVSSTSNKLNFSSDIKPFINTIRPTLDHSSTAVGYASITLPTLEEYIDQTGETTFTIINLASPDSMILTFNISEMPPIPIITSIEPVSLISGYPFTIHGLYFTSSMIIIIDEDASCHTMTFINEGEIRCETSVNLIGFHLSVVVQDNFDRNSLPVYVSVFKDITRQPVEICRDFADNCAACASIQSDYANEVNTIPGTTKCDFCINYASYADSFCVRTGTCPDQSWTSIEECAADWPVDPCSSYTESGCNSCLLQSGCGWCGRQEENTGSCISGDSEGPTLGTCPNENGGWRHQESSILNMCNITEFVIDLLTNPSEMLINGVTNNNSFYIEENNKYYFRILSSSIAPIQIYSMDDNQISNYIDDLKPAVTANGIEYSVTVGYIVITLPLFEDGITSFILRNLAYSTSSSMIATFNIVSKEEELSSSSSTGNYEISSSSSTSENDEESSSTGDRSSSSSSGSSSISSSTGNIQQSSSSSYSSSSSSSISSHISSSSSLSSTSNHISSSISQTISSSSSSSSSSSTGILLSDSSNLAVDAWTIVAIICIAMVIVISIAIGLAFQIEIDHQNNNNGINLDDL